MLPPVAAEAQEAARPEAVAEAQARSLRARVFGLTWLSYASYYLARKPFSVAKKHIQGDLEVSKSTLAHIDTGYLAAYAVGQFLAGYLADKFGAKRVIVVGMLLTAVCAVLFGASSAVMLLGGIWIVNGFAQATGWSPNLKTMTAWFPHKGRGTVMGFWTTNYVIGGLVAGPIAAAFIVRGTWRTGFFGPAMIVVAAALAIFLFLPRSRTADVAPRKDGEPPVAGPPQPPPPSDEARRAERRRVLRTPLLWALGSAYFFMKLARYMLLFWLIYYMQNELHYSTGRATWVSLAFEAGGAVAAISIGWLSERFGSGRRIPIGVSCLVCLAVALPFWGWAAPLGVGWNIFGLVLVGFFLFGPDALLSATAAQDLGGPLAAATAAGVINGMGSIGPVFGSEGFSSFTTAYGWTAGFALLGAGALASALILIPFWRRA